jgi:hypothetical protein
MKDIKIKHYLNKKLKPEIKNGVECYRVYFRFNLDGKNHRIPSFFISDYLESEKELNSLTLEIEEEEFFVNYFYREQNGNYSFNDYYTDIKSVAPSISLILKDYMNFGDVNEFAYHTVTIDQLMGCKKDYKNELIDFISKSNDFSTEFLESFFKNVPSLDFDGYYPVDFIKDPELKLFYQAYNQILDFSKERNIHLYDWIRRNKKEVFQEKYGDKSYQIVNKIVIQYYTHPYYF